MRILRDFGKTKNQFLVAVWEIIHFAPATLHFVYWRKSDFSVDSWHPSTGAGMSDRREANRLMQRAHQERKRQKMAELTATVQQLRKQLLDSNIAEHLKAAVAAAEQASHDGDEATPRGARYNAESEGGAVAAAADTHGAATSGEEREAHDVDAHLESHASSSVNNASPAEDVEVAGAQAALLQLSRGSRLAALETVDDGDNL